MYLICIANDFSKCISIEDTYEVAIKKFNYITEVEKIDVTIVRCK